LFVLANSFTQAPFADIMGTTITLLRNYSLSLLLPFVGQLNDSFSRRTLLHGVCYRHVYTSPVFHIQFCCRFIFCCLTRLQDLIRVAKSVYVTEDRAASLGSLKMARKIWRPLHVLWHNFYTEFRSVNF
jgi:hypothetical protein